MKTFASDIGFTLSKVKFNNKNNTLIGNSLINGRKKENYNNLK